MKIMNIINVVAILNNKPLNILNNRNNKITLLLIGDFNNLIVVLINSKDVFSGYKCTICFRV